MVFVFWIKFVSPVVSQLGTNEVVRGGVPRG